MGARPEYDYQLEKWHAYFRWAAFIAAIFIFPFLFPNAASATVFKGDAFASFAGALGTRNFALRTVDSDGSATDRAAWQMDAGASITVFFRTFTSGATPPALPDGDGTDACILRVYYETGATIIRTLHSASTCPANGTSFTIFGTDDGTVSGSPRAGTLRLYVQVTQTNELTDNYNVNSDSPENQGAIRSNILVSDITKNGYPNGSSRYAYGPTGDENMIFTVSATDRFADTNIEQFRINTRRSTDDVLIETGATQEWGTGGSTSDTFIADKTYDEAQTNYDAEFEVLTSSALCCTSGPERWTNVSNNGTLFKGATTAEKSNLFIVDPRIYFSSDGVTSNDNAAPEYSVYNRGETATSTFYLRNSRNEQLSRSMNISALNSGSNVEAGPTSVTPSSQLYTFAYTISSSHTAAADTTGSLKSFRATNTGQSKDSNSVFGVSSLYFVDMHPELDSTLNKDDFPTEDANETFSGVIAAEVFSFFAHVKNVRKDTNIDTSGSAVEFTVKRPDGSTRATQDSDTGSDGWTSNYDFSLESPSGNWTVTASTTFGGNAGTDTETLTFVSPYSGNNIIEAVGWNQTYDIGDTATFTIRTLERNDAGTFAATAADSAPAYTLRYWDGATWQDLASGAMTSLAATATYEITYAIPNDSAWIGRRIAISFSALMSSTRINETREIEIVGSPAQVIINDITDTTIPTVAASVRITNEGTAAFEYTYEYCVVTDVDNECGGNDDVAYGSAAKLIQAGTNFDSTLTLNVAQTGNYYWKMAVWWSNQSSKATKSFTATEGTDDATAATVSGGGGAGITTTETDTETEEDVPTLVEIWNKVKEIVLRLLGVEDRVSKLEAHIAELERQLNQIAEAPAPQRSPEPVTVTVRPTRTDIPARARFHIRFY